MAGSRSEMCREGSKQHRLGAIWYDDSNCTRKTCLKDGKILVDKCPIVREQKDCKLYFKDPELRFPDCCDYLVCQEIKDSTRESEYYSSDDSTGEFMRSW